jgi:hypothetical protein
MNGNNGANGGYFVFPTSSTSSTILVKSGLAVLNFQFARDTHIPGNY